MLLEVNHVKKIYSNALGGAKTEALKDVNFSVEKGDYVAIMGESGSGKTTLLNMIATFDKPTSGMISLEGKVLSELKERALADFRREQLGFVFQQFNLLDTFSVRDNILLPLVLAKKPYHQMKGRLDQVTSQLGITSLLDKYPYQISGGQQQRVAVARSLMNQPSLLLADEPTGALDSKSTDQLLEVFEEVSQLGQTIVMVTHSIKTASHARRVLFIKDGVVFHELYRGLNNSQEQYMKISDALSLIQAGDRHE